MTRRPGVSLVELMIALSLFSVLLVTTLAFYRQQGAAFTEGNERMTVMQNLRYAVNSIEQSLRTAGAGVPTKQPVLVYADADVIAFNADYATNQDNDAFAVYHDRTLPTGAVSALSPARRITVPRSAFTYPDSAYFSGSGNSPAETIVFFFTPDTATAREDDYVLYRQVNDLSPEVVARKLLKTGSAFFTYYLLDGARPGSPVTAIASTSLPMAHTAAIHGAPDDTGHAALVDSVRAVRVTYGATNGRSGARESVREITRLIRLPNAGLASQPNCGNAPILGVNLSAAGVDASGSAPGHVRLTWPRAVDEHTGEQDVLRYVLWRREGTSGTWGDPLVSVSPGSLTYVHQDFTALEGRSYTYALAAQDCTPQYSSVAVAGPVKWDD